MSESKTLSFAHAMLVIRDLPVLRCQITAPNYEIIIEPGKLVLCCNDVEPWRYIDRKCQNLFDTFVSLGQYLYPFSGFDISEAMADIEVKITIWLENGTTISGILPEHNMAFLDSRSLCKMPMLVCLSEFKPEDLKWMDSLGKRRIATFTADGGIAIIGTDEFKSSST